MRRMLLAGSHCQPNDLVFRTRTGAPQRNTNMWAVFKRLLKRAGLPPIFTVQDLRATAASTLINADATLYGVSKYHVSKYQGHSGIQTTANEYGHLFSQRRQELADLLSQQLSTDTEAAG